jgi:2-polyprenyl-3-methyl-5-hydroxy-6-metoxy-1,4-benzoquinol methylase
MTIPPNPGPNPGRIMETLNAYQQTYALKGAIELELFTHISDGATTASTIAVRTGANERALRILCDYLAILGYLTKSGDTYSLSTESERFLDKHSPAYLGDAARFLANQDVVDRFRDMAALVRRGGVAEQGTTAPDDPIWVEFARSMAPMVTLQAQLVAPLVTTPGKPAKVLDIAAGHGLFGLFVAKHNPAALVVAVDWASVLEVARQNAAAFGVSDRYRTISGSAFDVDLGADYDLVLLPNFLHHFDLETNVRLLRKVRGAMKGGGVVATVEFVPNEDRITPPAAAAFSMTMLGTTPSGDAYTFAELDQMFHDAGFDRSELRSLDPAPQRLVLTRLLPAPAA